MKRLMSLLLLSLLLGAISLPLQAEKTGNPVVIIETSMGTMKAELYPDKAPITVKNFLRYVDEKFYDGTIFHRVISNFVIQGGGFDSTMKRRETHEPIKNEATNGLKNTVGTLSMARTSVPDSATSQFYINVKNNPSLDNRGTSPTEIGYCVFGKVIEGMDVVNKIRSTPTGVKNSMADVPVTPVVIKSIRLVK